MYVHLTSGIILKVENAGKLEVTNDAVIINCGLTEPHAVEFRLKDVYFASCEQSLPPPAK
jgi:hypothetical protein